LSAAGHPSLIGAESCTNKWPQQGRGIEAYAARVDRFWGEFALPDVLASRSEECRRRHEGNRNVNVSAWPRQAKRDHAGGGENSAVDEAFGELLPNQK
jgi:hypothetical protein